MNTIINKSYNILHVIKVQSHVRRFLSNKKYIYKKLKTPIIKNAFKSEILGYHLINETPIKESVWEEINRNIVKHNCIVNDAANGNHLSGKDNKFDNWDISNKTAKVDKNVIKLSSYRLTNVCDSKHNGRSEVIIKEIEKRDNTFNYYSLLLRKENGEQITYIWCIIPKDYYVFKLNKTDFNPKIGVKGARKGAVVGWTGAHFDITFSMSSQLWYNFDYKSIEKYIIDEITVTQLKNRLSYSDIYKIYTSTTDDKRELASLT